MLQGFVDPAKPTLERAFGGQTLKRFSRVSADGPSSNLGTQAAFLEPKVVRSSSTIFN